MLAVAAPGTWTRYVLVDGAIRDGFSSGPTWAPYARSLGLVMFLLLLISIPGMIDRARREDTMLRREFGQEWEKWAQKTPYRLIPGIY
jgi:protein-S-isoprenylcysteine O-methyltransferase Ste14